MITQRLNRLNAIIAPGVAALVAFAAFFSVAAEESGSSTNRIADISTKELKPLVWSYNLSYALADASASYRPVLALFSSDYCSWCERLKETLSFPELNALLGKFVLVELNVKEHKDIAAHYMVRNIPAMVFLASDGRVKSRVAGYRDVISMRQLLLSILNPKAAQKVDSASKILDVLKSMESVPRESWPDVVLGISDPVLGSGIRESLLKREDFNPSNIVHLLRDSRLAVRMGTLDLLEEFSGETFGYDVWAGEHSPESEVALELWNAWSLKPENAISLTRFVSLEPEQVRKYFRDLTGNGHSRSTRAMRLLISAGPSVINEIAAYIKAHPELPAGSIKKLMELKYALILSGQGNGLGAETAHRLVFGNMDVVLDSLEKLSAYPRGASFIYRDFLNNPEPMIRESAADGLFNVLRVKALPYIVDALKEERDNDCIFAMLKGVGQVKTQGSRELLMTYCGASYEDHAVIAFEGLADQEAIINDEVKAVMLAGLKDSRWRVRVEALKAVAAFKIKSLLGDAEPLLNDPDDFVRYTAVISLARIGNPETLKKFNKLFMDSPQNRLAVLEAYVAIEKALPNEFVKVMKTSDPDELLQMFSVMEGREKKSLNVVKQLLSHESSDVVNAALSFIAASGVGVSEYRGELVYALKNGDAARKRAVIENLDWDPVEDETYLKRLASKRDDSIVVDHQDVAKDKSQAGAVINQFRQMIDAEKKVKPEKVVAKAKPVKKRESVLGAFSKILNASATSGEDRGSSVSGPQRSASVEDLVQAISMIIKNEKSEVQFQAALTLAQFGAAVSIPVISENLKTSTEDERRMIARYISRYRGERKELVMLTRSLLNDSSSDVRTAMVESLSSTSRKELVELLFEEALKSESLLSAEEISAYRRQSYYSSRNRISVRLSPSETRKYAQEFIKRKSSVDYRILGLMLLSSSSGPDSIKLVEKYLKDPENLLRRASARALSKMSRSRFDELASEIADDSSEKVRVVVLAAWDESYAWQDLFSGSADQNHYGYSNRSSISLNESQIKILRKLSRDKSLAIRVNAYFCMIANRVPFDLTEFCGVIDQLPEQDAVIRRVSSMFTSYSVEKLGTAFKVMLPYLERSDRLDEGDWKKIEKHFGPLEKSDTLEQFVAFKSRVVEFAASNTLVSADEMYPEVSSNVVGGADSSVSPLRIFLFSNAGCEECAKVKHLLTQLRKGLPELNVVTHDIMTVKGFQLNEALCERFGVPASGRAATPAVFAESGVLIKTQINNDSLSSLVRASRGFAPERLVVTEEQMERAAEVVQKKKSDIKLWLIILFGLLDGVNPCAFATLIFLISYLQVARRNIHQIALIGLSFITAVFLTYFALGLGLRRLIGELKLLHYGGLIFNWVVIVFAVALCALNLRDAVICSRGRLDKMVLQLPSLLKKQIHSTIKVGAKHRMFVLAAFVIGVVVSLLELACTGAVYVPVLHMLSEPGSRSVAVIYLLLYNFMFILPLIIVFALVCKGLTSEKLIKWMRENVVKVKIMTAVLFAVLAMVLLFDEQIKGLITSMPSQTSEVGGGEL